MSEGLTASEANAWVELIEVMRTEPYNMPARLEARRRFIWATRAPIEARAESAEARVAEMEAVLRKIELTAYEMGSAIGRIEIMHGLVSDALTAPTTEAVTE